MSKKRRKKLSEQLRQAVNECGMSRNAIARATGIDKGALSRFVHGERGLSLATLDLLGEVLGLRVMADAPAKKKAKRRTARKDGGK